MPSLSSRYSDSDESSTSPKLDFDKLSLDRRRLSAIMPRMESIKEEEEVGGQKFSENYISDIAIERKAPNSFLKLMN